MVTTKFSLRARDGHLRRVLLMDYTLAKFSTIQVQNVNLYNASKIISLSGQTHMIQAEKTLVQSEKAN